MWPAWCQMCRVCGKLNHFERVCHSKSEEKRGTLWCIKYEEAAIFLMPWSKTDQRHRYCPLNHQWNTTGKVITVLPNRQYRIKVDGSGKIMLRNRFFLRKCKFKTAPKPTPSATPEFISPTINTPLLHPDPPTFSSNDTHTTIVPPQTNHTYIYTSSVFQNSQSSIQTTTK